MMMPDYNTEPKSYKSYQNKFFNKYMEKARSLVKAIDSLSLKEKDKEILRNNIAYILKSKS